MPLALIPVHFHTGPPCRCPENREEKDTGPGEAERVNPLNKKAARHECRAAVNENN